MENEDLLSMTPLEREEERKKCENQRQILSARLAHPEENLTGPPGSEVANLAYALCLLNERIAAIDDLQKARKHGTVISFRPRS